MRSFVKNFHSIILGIIGITSIFFAISAFSYADNSLTVHFLDVGQGDATLIQTPSGRQILIDGGKDALVMSALGRAMKFSDRDLDIVIATHPDLDHVGGLIPVVRNYDVETFIYSGLLAGASAYRELANEVNTQSISAIQGVAGQRIILDQDVYLDILGPSKSFTSTEANEFSLITRLTYQDSSMLLTGDATKFNEHELVEFYGDYLQSDILKLGHHGSKTSSSAVFLDVVQPHFSVVSASCDNRFGHPNEDVLNRVLERGIEVYDTCKDGDVSFESDGVGWEMAK